MQDSAMSTGTTMRFMADVDDKIDAHSYPATTEELVEAYGEQELELADGTETFGEVVERLGEQTFEDAEEVRLTAYSAVSEGAVGRQNYSDRDAPGLGESGHEQVSF
jgi:hypothetical protein